MSNGVPLMVQGMVDGGEMTRRSSSDNSASLGHSPTMMAIIFLTFSLRNVAFYRIHGRDGNQWLPRAEIV